MARTYRSPSREKQAEQTKVQICLAAEPLFSEQGYAATSMRQLATVAGVSMDTIYALGGKADVFLRALEITLSGSMDGTLLYARPELAVPPPGGSLRDALALVAAVLTDANRRSAGMWSAFVEGANTDPVLAAAYRKRIEDMREEGRRLVHRLVEWGLCRLPDDLDCTVDLCWVTAQHSAYTLLVRDCGWTPEEYREMMLDRFLELLDR
ncbi:TetR/AcrR family transcriptional regulator [Umezawaea endophytica]|uniref:TetR/AcrR family transcriptional regulator n=1 Tax=Umezawaea endophytica TaxID=1654476 RepID=A0A9X2VVB8_9PSEU|nr:TetR/AcrR family transcriptional regulator [Umezawaea endophytica]MCS7482872.1 TetR/AcrR family transcriptional regulator [Umezawaea endophytica]